MLVKLLSTLYFYYKKFTTPADYQIISEELEYKINHDMKFLVEDPFWKQESKDWDGILDHYYVDVTGENFRNTSIPQNVEHIILRIKYFFNNRVYTVLTNDLNYRLIKDEEKAMGFHIPLSSVWIVDHDDKPLQNITERVRRYSGPLSDFHGEKVSLEDFLYYEPKYLKERFPKIMLVNGLGMKKCISTTTSFTTDLRIP